MKNKQDARDDTLVCISLKKSLYKKERSEYPFREKLGSIERELNREETWSLQLR